MIDAPIRARIDPMLDRVGVWLRKRGVRAGHVTSAGLAVGLGAAGAAAASMWRVALALWLLNRVLDGIDGPIARTGHPSPLGGYFDFVADYVVYVSVPVAVAYAVPSARLAVAVMFAAFLLNVVQLLTLSSIAEQRDQDRSDGRALHFGTGLVEGGETILAYAIVLALPNYATQVFTGFAALVLITAGQRLFAAMRALG